MSDQAPATGGHIPPPYECSCFSQGEPDTEPDFPAIYQEDGPLLAWMEHGEWDMKTAEATAGFMTLACNSYDPMLAALDRVERRLLDRTDDEANLPSDLREILADVRAAQRAARGSAS